MILIFSAIILIFEAVIFILFGMILIFDLDQKICDLLQLWRSAKTASELHSKVNNYERERCRRRGRRAWR